MAQNTETTPISIERHGVKITKMLDENTFNQGLAVRFTIESVHNEPLDIRVLDQLPDGFEIDNVGFHPDYYKDNWDIHDNKFVVFDYELSPDETIDTLYVAAGHDNVSFESFQSEPQIVEANSVSTHTKTTEDTDADADTHDSENDPQDDTSWFETTDEHEDTSDAPVETTASHTDENNDTTEESPETNSTLTDSSESTSTPTQSSGTDATTTPSDPQTTADSAKIDTEADVASALSEQITAGTVDDETLRVIATAVSDHIATDGAPEVRLEHLETRVSELEAYSTALEDFLNKSGTADELTTELAELSDSISMLETRLNELESDPADDRLETIENDITTLHEDVETLLSWRNAMTSALDK